MKAPVTNRGVEQAAPDGFIVVAVLWILSLLATLVSIYVMFVLNTASAFSVRGDQFRGEGLVSAALELAAYQLATPREVRPTRGQFSFRMSEANVAVEFRSEAARIDLNAAPKEVLAGLFASLGAPPDNADDYANRIVGWRTAPAKGDDSEAALYKAARLKYAPRGARFPHVDELSLVLDLPKSLVERALPLVTVYSGRAQVNVLDAAPEVIAALPGITRERLNAVLARQRATGDGQSLLALLGPAQKYATVEGSKASRVTVHTAFDDGLRMNSEAVILVFDEGPDPYAILSWHDGLDDLRADDAPRTALR
jgi:general secretion pathway protein K